MKQYQTTWNGWPKECFDWEKLSYFSKKIQLFSFAHILGLKLNLVSCRHLDISETLLWKNRESVSSHIIVSMEFSKKSKKNPIFGYFFRNFFWKTIRTLRNSIELLETAHYNPNNILAEKVKLFLAKTPYFLSCAHFGSKPKAIAQQFWAFHGLFHDGVGILTHLLATPWYWWNDTTKKRRGVYFESWNSFYGIFEKNKEKFLFWSFLNKFLKIYHNLLGLCQTTWDARYDPTNVFP